MGRLVHGVRGLHVEVGHGLGVGQDAGGDHEGQHVHCDQQDCAHREREEQALETVQCNIILRSNSSLTVGMFSSI